MCENETIREATTALSTTFTAAAEDHFFALEVQGTSTKIISENICRSNITVWNKVMDSLPQILFRFARKALLQVLPTNSNLARWNISTNSGCSLCGSSKQTNKHVLANCPAALERFKIRHNNILLSLANWIQGVKSRGSSLCVDVESEIFQPIGIVFKDSIRPDIVLFDASTCSCCAGIDNLPRDEPSTIEIIQNEQILEFQSLYKFPVFRTHIKIIHC